jgi:beta-glucanase (GH16 family)
MQWSAFWTSGVTTWPPEIDIFEAYTDQDVKKIEIQPNIHWRSGRGKKMYGAPTIPVKNPSDRFVKYAIHWTDKYIKFYYDEILVQVCTNHEMLKDNAAEQFIIINNGLQQPTDTNQPTEGKMVVKNLKVFQKKS